MTALALPADLGIATVTDVRALLVAGLAEAGGTAGRTLHVDLSAVEDLDTAGLQLLLALSAESRAAGIGLAVTGCSDAAATLLRSVSVDPADLDVPVGG